LNFSGITIFSHAQILHTIDEIQKNENIDAVNKLWQEFITYKHPFDENLTIDVTRFFFVIAKNLLIQTIEKKK
jgi:hypothetical protein